MRYTNIFDMSSESRLGYTNMFVFGAEPSFVLHKYIFARYVGGHVAPSVGVTSGCTCPEFMCKHANARALHEQCCLSG